MKITNSILLLVLTFSMNSCKNDQEQNATSVTSTQSTDTSGDSASPQNSPSPNLPPTLADLIEETPVVIAQQDMPWSFQPKKLKTQLTFSAKGSLPWAKINPVTGELHGIPDEVRAYDNITVTAKKDNTYDVIGPLSIQVVGDPFKAQAWHLKNTGQSAFSTSGGTAGEDINLTNTIAQGITGNGIKVAVSDNGVELNHEDLKDRVIANASRNYTLKTSPWIGDPLPSDLSASGAGHGTSVAGLIAASGWNSLGSRGVAPNAQFAGFQYIDSSQAVAFTVDQANGLFDIFNYSYGSSTCQFTPLPSILREQFRWGVKNLRSGKGAIYVKAAGNEKWGNLGDCIGFAKGIPYWGNSNLDGNNSIPEIIVVGALNANGKASSYSSPGANVWISAPGGEFGKDSPAMITTDLSGCNNGFAQTSNDKNSFEQGKSGNTDCNYTSTMNGTSSATPITSGAIALLLSARPDLTWRDVKYILAKTATRVDPDAGPTGHPFWIDLENHTYQQGWVKNSAGFYFHNNFGFGRINVDAALALAKTYKSELGDYVETTDGDSQFYYSSNPYQDQKSLFFGNEQAIPDASAEGATSSIEVLHDLKIESVQVEFYSPHDDTSDLGIELTSPSGTKSILMNINSFMISHKFNHLEDYPQLLSNAFLDEMSYGTWKLKIIDGYKKNTGYFGNWRIKINGHLPNTQQDRTPPDPVRLISHDSTTSNPEDFPAITWSPSTSPDIRRYEYSIGTGPGKTDVFNWKLAGAGTSIPANNSFSNPYVRGTQYYVNIRAVDKAENKSAVTSSTGWLAGGS